MPKTHTRLALSYAALCALACSAFSCGDDDVVEEGCCVPLAGQSQEACGAFSAEGEAACVNAGSGVTCRWESECTAEGDSGANVDAGNADGGGGGDADSGSAADVGADARDAEVGSDAGGSDASEGDSGTESDSGADASQDAGISDGGSEDASGPCCIAPPGNNQRLCSGIEARGIDSCNAQTAEGASCEWSPEARCIPGPPMGCCAAPPGGNQMRCDAREAIAGHATCVVDDDCSWLDTPECNDSALCCIPSTPDAADVCLRFEADTNQCNDNFFCRWNSGCPTVEPPVCCLGSDPADNEVCANLSSNMSRCTSAAPTCMWNPACAP